MKKIDTFRNKATSKNVRGSSENLWKAVCPIWILALWEFERFGTDLPQQDAKIFLSIYIHIYGSGNLYEVTLHKEEGWPWGQKDQYWAREFQKTSIFGVIDNKKFSKSGVSRSEIAWENFRRWKMKENWELLMKSSLKWFSSQVSGIRTMFWWGRH